jgi:hypothetical protein
MTISVPRTCQFTEIISETLSLIYVYYHLKCYTWFFFVSFYYDNFCLHMAIFRYMSVVLKLLNCMLRFLSHSHAQC